MTPSTHVLAVQKSDSKGLSRNTLKVLWALAGVTGVIIAIFVAKTAQNLQIELEDLKVQIDAKQRELDNAQRLSATLSKIDEMTINENSATRLGILRHLGLEQTTYTLDISSKAQEQVGSTMLLSRGIRVTANGVGYEEALTLADKLHNGGKLNITGLELTPDALTSNHVNISIEGQLYGLNKQEGK